MSDRDLTTTTTQVFGTAEKGTTCRICGRNVDDGRMVHCSDYCKNIASAVMSMLNWTSVRRRILDRDDRTCQECGFKQEWLDRGHEHLRDIVSARCPEKPESPSLEEYAELPDGEIEAHQQAYREWRDACHEVSREVLGYDWHPGSACRYPYSRLEVDHITPISDGGHPFDPANLRTLCEDCHGEKTARENSERNRTPSQSDLNESLFEYVTADGGENQ